MLRKKERALFLALFCAFMLPGEGYAQAPGLEVLCEEGSQDGILIRGGLPNAKGTWKARAASGEYDFENDRIIAEAMEAMSSRISVEGMGITTDNVTEIVNRIWNTNPGLFYLEEWEYSYYPSTGKVTDLLFTYTGTEEEIFQQRQEIQKAVADAEKTFAKEHMADEEIALALHDYLAGHVKYAYGDYLADTVSPSAYSIYGALAEGEAVCQGYAMAYGYLLDIYGIPNRIVVSDETDHAWNLVRIGETWYHVDVTRDDPSWDNLGQALHSTFLISTESLLSIEPHRRDFAVVEREAGVLEYVSDARFEGGFWRDSSGVMHYYGGFWYYADRMQPEIVKYSYSTGQRTVLARIDNLWLCGDSEYWEESFSRMARMDDMLYYSAPMEVYSLEPDSGETTCIFSLDSKGGYIYGLGIRDGKLAYALKSEPDADEAEEIRALELPVDKRVDEEPVKEEVKIPMQPKPQEHKPGLKKGDVISSGKIRYQILSLNGKTGTVRLKGLHTKNVRTVKIPAQITKEGYGFTVTAIGAKAFKNCRKLKTVVIGKEITSIGRGAFSGCRKLTRVTIKTKKLKKVGKNAFHGVPPKITVKAPNKKRRAYRRMLRAAGIKSL